MNSKLKQILKAAPLLGRVLKERDQLRIELGRLQSELRNELSRAHKYVPDGHFYSPIPLMEDIRENEERIFRIPAELPAIDLNVEEQLRLLSEFRKYYNEMPFKPERTDGLRYFFNNPAYSYADGTVLYSMIRHLKPERIIEVGSGYSSCVILDVNEHFYKDAISCTFIDPFPDLINSLIKQTDNKKNDIVPKKLQDVGLEKFLSLKANDILFIDSSHVSKVDSDVNHIFFEILPALRSGVNVHFHDVFYPFEYPKFWFLEGRAWNEDYVLRAFLEYNNSFRIAFYTTFLKKFYASAFEEALPIAMKNPGGSIWIKKI